ncbi:MAG: hypothetical protein KA735_14690, partial [Burkholderiaceae bacterium]|nr:hypothetical protein [Burkholderiaceae bacterium]
RKVKRLRADDSGRTSVKVGHRQALIPKPPSEAIRVGFCYWDNEKENTIKRKKDSTSNCEQCMLLNRIASNKEPRFTRLKAKA